MLLQHEGVVGVKKLDRVVLQGLVFHVEDIRDRGLLDDVEGLRSRMRHERRGRNRGAP